MVTITKVFLLTFTVILIKDVAGNCHNECSNNTYGVLREESKVISEKDVVGACSFGCRMQKIDRLLSWPYPTNMTKCRKLCVEAYGVSLEELRSCIIGCNTTTSLLISTGDEESKATNEDSTSVLSYFTTYTLTLFAISDDGDGKNDDMSNQSSTNEQEKGQGEQRIIEYIYVYVYGDDLSNNSSATGTFNDSAIRLSFATIHSCLWTMLQFLCFVMILVSFVICFCMFFTKEEEIEEEKEQKDKYREQLTKPFLDPLTEKTAQHVYTLPMNVGGDKKVALHMFT